MSVNTFKQYIFTYDSKSQSLVEKPISDEERIDLIERVLKFPGEMNLDERILFARRQAEAFDIKGLYCDKVPGSRDFISFWDREKKLCYTGLLIDDEYYITGDFYWWLNYIKIPDKVKGGEHFPRLFDTHMWFSMLLELAELTHKFTATVKARQKGISLFIDSKILKRFWFEELFVGKVASFDDRYVHENWSFLEMYRDHLNKHTAWFRGLYPSKTLDWQQRTAMQDGSFIGLKSKLKGMTFRTNPASVVAGKTDEVFIDEAGIAPNLNKVIEFASPALTFGDIVTGFLHVSGAVGELKDCKPLEDMIKNPDDHNVLSLPNVWADEPNQRRGIFIPEYYSYGTCIDLFGNSLVDKAKEIIEEKAMEQKAKSYSSYQLYRSQRPLTIKDAFAIREENIFPIDIIEPHYEWLCSEYNPTRVELVGEEGLIRHMISDKYEIVKDFPINKGTNKHGAICVAEPPMSNPPVGLYYAGVDTITPIKTTSSVSLQSIHIYKASHEIDGEFSSERCVAWYTGRPDDPYEAFEICLRLIEWYNARACIESDNRNFIEWMIKKKKTKYMMKRNQLPLSKDLVIRSSIDRSEYGIKMTKEFKKYLFSLGVEYCGEIISTTFKDDGSSVDTYGVTRISDEMVLVEMLNYSPRKNVDRLISFFLSIFAARSNSYRGLVVRSSDNRNSGKKVVNYNKRLRETAFKNSFKMGSPKLGF